MSNLEPRWDSYKRSLSYSEQDSAGVRLPLEEKSGLRQRAYFFYIPLFLVLSFIVYWSVLSRLSFDIERYLDFSQGVFSGESGGPLTLHIMPSIELDAHKNSLPPSPKATISSVLKTGELIDGLLGDLGFASDMILPVKESLKDLKDSAPGKSFLKAGASVKISFDLKDGIEEIISEVDSSSELRIKRQSPGIYKAFVLSTSTVTKERIVVGSIDSSFASSASKQGLTYEMVDDLVDIFSDRVSFHRDFRKGDRFTLIFNEHEVNDGSKTVPGPILGAALEVKGEHLIALRYVGEDGKARYFNEKGEEIGNTFLRFPLKFSKISSYFSTARFHPVLKIKRPHHGVDFSAPTGTPVRSVASGVVEFSGRKGGHGIIVEIRHSDRFTTGYSHLSKIASGIHRGARVNKGDVIGAVGMTGLATGPHLHFSLYDRGKYVDPLRTDLPLAEDTKRGNKIDERYLKIALFTLEHFQNVSENSVLGK